MSRLSDGGRRCLYLVATTGHPNYGDELVTAQWLRYLAQTWPEADVWVDCHTPGLSQLLFGHLHPRVRFVDTLWRMCWAAPSDDPALVAAFVARAVNRAGVVASMDIGRPLLRNADVLHIVGGGYVNAFWPRHYGLLAGIIEAARASGGRTAITGQGLLPVTTGGHDVLRKLVIDLDVCDVRDQPSEDLLRGLTGPRMSRTVDDACIGLGPHTYDFRQAPDVMVCAQSDFLDLTTDRLADLVKAVLDGWGAEPHQVGWIEAMPVADRRVYDLVERQQPGMRFYPFSEIWEFGMPARAGQLWLSTRYHPHLLAAAAGCWGLAVPVKGKYYDIKHEALLAQGSGWTMLDPAAEPDPAILRRPRASVTGFDPSQAELAAAKVQVAEALYGDLGT